MSFLDFVNGQNSGLLDMAGDGATLDGAAVRGLFDSVFPAADLGGVPVNILEPTFYIPEVDVPPTVAGKVLVTGGKSYSVIRSEPDGTGWAYLVLRAL